jgi:hypothetical protein
MVDPLRNQCACLKKHGIDIDAMKVGPKDPETGELIIPVAKKSDGDDSDDESKVRNF